MDDVFQVDRAKLMVEAVYYISVHVYCTYRCMWNVVDELMVEAILYFEVI